MNTEDMLQKVAKEHVLREYNKFHIEHGVQLETVNQIYKNISKRTLSHQISLEAVPFEDISLADLIQTNNDALRNVVLTFIHLIEEMDFLIKEGQSFYSPLQYYGEGIDNRDFQNGECHTCAAKMIPFLQKLLNYIAHCYKVVENIFCQLTRLYCHPENGPKFLEIWEAHLKIIFERLGELLANFVCLDSIINQNSLLREHMAQFQHVVRSVQHTASSFATTPEELGKLDLILDEIIEKMLSGTIFLRCVTMDFGPSVSENKILLEEIGTNVKGCLQGLLSQLEKETEKDSLENLRKFMHCVCLHVLHAHVASIVDKKQLKIIIDLSRLIVAVPLKGCCLWFPDQFLSLYLPKGNKVVDSKTLESIASARFNYLRAKSQQLNKDAQIWNGRILLLMSRLSIHVSGQEELTNQCGLVLQGCSLLAQMSGTIHLLMNLHLSIQPVVAKVTVFAIFRTFELIKSLASALEKHVSALPQAWLHLQQQLRRSVLEMITNAIKLLTNEKRPKSGASTCSSALLLAQHLITGACTRQRVAGARLSLAIATGFTQPRVFRDDEISLLARHLQKMELMSTGVGKRIRCFADCEIFYWHKSLLDTYLSEAHQKHFESSRLEFALAAVSDCKFAILQVKHTNPESLSEQYEQFIRQALKRNVLDPLCTDIETELRIQTHSHLHPGGGHNPFKSDLSCLPNELQNLNVKMEVEHYLSRTFYNLAALASHDWQTYGQMRLMARMLFDLNPLQDRLPSHTLEQGLDVLEIMRNIHVFVARYGYNLNNQFFVEESSGSKHLNTIGIRHVSNSIRTHGSGIVNTAVNFTYQFLRKKFFVFSQFLYDEHIKSRLMKDARFLRELADKEADTRMKYPYDRAEKFHRGIRKLGLNPQGLSYLDQFRALITHIGNALGYVRMLRSGAIHCSAKSCSSVPDLEELVNLNENAMEHLATKSISSLNSIKGSDLGANESTEGLFETLAKANASLSTLSILSSKTLDKVLDNLAQNLSESSDYFKLLVDVFRPFFRDQRHLHLRYFYLIVPPLTVNYAEHIVTCKEKLNKKNKEGAAFTDDGLAMGVAYCLSVLDQWKDFDTLQWPASVQEFFQHQIKAAHVLSNSQDAEKLQQTRNLTLHRLYTYQQEFDLLFYNLNSARIFFREEQMLDKYGSTSSLAV